MRSCSSASVLCLRVDRRELYIVAVAPVCVALGGLKTFPQPRSYRPATTRDNFGGDDDVGALHQRSDDLVKTSIPPITPICQVNLSPLIPPPLDRMTYKVRGDRNKPTVFVYDFLANGSSSSQKYSYYCMLTVVKPDLMQTQWNIDDTMKRSRVLTVSSLEPDSYHLGSWSVQPGC